MMSSRLPSRIAVLLLSIMQLWHFFLPRKKSNNPKVIWVVHQLYLGDTIMLTGLLAKLRTNHPSAKIFMIAPPCFHTLYQEKPYGVEYIAYNPRQVRSLILLFKFPKADWVIIPAENRYGWLAFSLGAKWIVGFKEDKTTYKDIAFDELIAIPTSKVAMPELMQCLVDGNNPPPYSPKDWDIINTSPFTLPSTPYALFHVSAKSATKLWDTNKWLELITYFKKKKINIVLSSAPEENTTIDAIKKIINIQTYQGNLTLLQLTELIRKAELVICLDNGVGQLTKIIGAPTVCLLGSGSSELYGQANFWINIKFYSVTKKIVECRNSRKIFNREIPWVRTCNRSPSTCTQKEYICMKSISTADVIDTIETIPSPKNREPRV